MPIINDIVPAGALTAFVREVPTPASYILNQFLPDRQVNDIEAVIDSVSRTNRAAKFRAYDAETPIGQRDPMERKRVTLPPLGQKTVLGEYERLMLERVRNGGGNTATLVDSVYDDVEINARAVLARMELARGDVLSDGKFTLAGENGLTIEADFGIPANHVVAPAALWSDHANSTPLTDLRSWADTYVDSTGEDPGVFLTSRAVVSDILQSAEVRTLLGSLTGTPNIVTQGQLNTLLESHQLPQIRTYNTRIDVDGVSTRPVAADKVLFLPSDPESLGYTAWGITAEGLELAGGDNPELVYEQLPGLVGVVLKEGDPVRTWTKVGAVGMPVLQDPRRLLVADVR